MGLLKHDGEFLARMIQGRSRTRWAPEYVMERLSQDGRTAGGRGQGPSDRNPVWIARKQSRGRVPAERRNLEHRLFQTGKCSRCYLLCFACRGRRKIRHGLAVPKEFPGG